MPTEKFLTYRGDIQAVAGVGGVLAFVTVHPEGQPTAVYRLDADKLTLEAAPLPAGGRALVAAGDTLWIGGSDGILHVCAGKDGAPTARGGPLPTPPTALAPLAGDRLAVLAGAEVVIVARADGAVLQSLPLPEAGTALAADPTGQWLAAGTVQGTVAVFDGEDRPAFVVSETEKLHDGAVTALLFEPDELRFFSAGADQKLLSTHARGKLEPEDKGRSNHHEEAITALVWGPGDRFYSGSTDKTVKNWPRVGGVKPATLKDDVTAVVGLAVVQVHTRAVLAAACAGNTIRLFPIDAAGKFGECTHRIYGIYGWMKNELGQDDHRRREAALRALAEFNDAASLETIAARVSEDSDHELRLLAAQLLGQAAHPRAATLLEPCLAHADEAVRRAAFAGLRRHLGATDLRAIDLALKADRADVGTLAVGALQPLARTDDQALARLLAALDANTLEVRQAALGSLEAVHEAQSPEADLQGLQSKHADVRRLALIRLFQRRLLGQPRVRSAIRWRTEDADADVRRTAFLLALLTREKLAQALRARDPELDRQLAELETFGQAPAKKDKAAAGVLGQIAGLVGTLIGRKQLDVEEADCEPLLQAAASRALDTSLRGATGLAVLGDGRAFGLLLQLSREDNAAARAGVCRALAALADPRGSERLRSLLYDGDGSVRDAAFTALARILAQDPLGAAEAGLNASGEDVRRRGLQVLLAAVRQSPPTKAVQPGWQLLLRALNDTAASVRSEAFKAAINLKIAGGGIQTLRFVLQSIHADVRREVLTEAMAQVDEPWAWNLLLEFCNDADPALRREAFEFAVKKARELQALEPALLSQYQDIRLAAVEELIKKATPPAQVLLVRALADADKEVRRRALEALVHRDAQPALLEALASPHGDVRAAAALAVARHGNAAALAPLIALASTPLPEAKDRPAELGAWAALVANALRGLAELGDAAALPYIIPLLQIEAVRKEAAQALCWCAIPHHAESLRQALHHADPVVKYHAALGLALAGDALVAALVFSDPARQVLQPADLLAAALGLGAAGEPQLVALLDHPLAAVREAVLVVVLMLELKAHQGAPRRLLACLAAGTATTRLAAAAALERFGNPPALLGLITERCGSKHADTWKAAEPTVDALAELIVHGAPATRARSVHLVPLLTESKLQAPWDQAWRMHEQRCAAELARIRDQARRRTALEPTYSQAQLEQLAFGAYVGLIRDQRGQFLRRSALERAMALARRESAYARACLPVFVQALADPVQEVRKTAFAHLRTLGMDPATLGAEALEAGHLDIGVLGLELLTGGAGAQGQAVLEQVMLTRQDELAVEAAKLLAAQRGQVAVAAALAAGHEPLRQRAVAWLAAEYEKDPAAPAHLRQALQSRYQLVRETAALELAGKKDTAAFDALVTLLRTPETPGQPRQLRAIEALVTLGDPRTPAALLDRLDQDASGTARVGELLRAVGQFRRVEVVDRLLTLVEKDAQGRAAAFAAAYTISGFDQPIEDPDDARADKSWEAKQHPRHSAVLAKMLERVLPLNEPELLAAMLPGLYWSRGHEADAGLAQLAAHGDEDLRRNAIVALGWRLRRRGGAAEPVLKALSHKDPISQFLAAEGLALAGRREGLPVLLASIEYLGDVALRGRAVTALGALADQRALDRLLQLAGEEGHALQDVAAEAIGHLGQSPQAERIFALLERHARGQGRIAVNALQGLRWFNTPAGWQLIRRRAAEPGFPYRQVAVELLGSNDEPVTRDLLLQLLRTDTQLPIAVAANTSGGRLFGVGTLELDYAWLQNPLAARHEDGSSLRRVGAAGDAARVFALLPHCAENVQDALASALLRRTPLPTAEAAAALGSAHDSTVRLAGQVVGRASAVAAGPALTAALAKWQQAWHAQRKTRSESSAPRLRQLTECVQALVWAAGRLGVAGDLILYAATAHLDDRAWQPVRRAALEALAAAPTPDALPALETAAQGNDPELRALAAAALARHQPQRAAKLAEPLLSDRISFGQLSHLDLGDTLRTAAVQVHYQGVALPHLLARGDVEGLAAVALASKLGTSARLGAIEGLARLGTEPAEAKLLTIAKNPKEDEELRKAVWRALRRMKRTRSKTGAGGKAP